MRFVTSQSQLELGTQGAFAEKEQVIQASITLKSIAYNLFIDQGRIAGFNSRCLAAPSGN
jgi:hypothetical protein